MTKIGFPPKPAYPVGLDTNRTLFLVYNTTESQLSFNNLAWSDAVEIIPVAADKAEIWPDNGFANIDGELFYYDEVDVDGNGKVNKLLRCARNLGGDHTKFNKAGTWVRGFVVAEHHNQLANTIVSIENFIGQISSEDPETIDYRIRRLEKEIDCTDDYTCVDVNFAFDVVSTISVSDICDPSISLNNQCVGTEVSYTVDLVGSFTDFRLDFGDGTWTTAMDGNHIYPPNTTIDPVVTVANSQCKIIQTPSERTNVTVVPSIAADTTPTIPTYDIVIPDINIPSFTLPSVTFTLPPIVTQCISIPDINIPSVFIDIITELVHIPSVIVFENLPDIPSIITIADVQITSVIMFDNIPEIPSIITFDNIPEIPSIIVFDNIPELPSVIVFDNIPEIPSIIVFDNIPELPSVIIFADTPEFPSVISVEGLSDISLIVPEIPDIIVDWYPVPNLTITRPTWKIQLQQPQWAIMVSMISVISLVGCSEISLYIPDKMISVDWGEDPTINVEVTVTCSEGSSSMRRANANFISTEDGLGSSADFEPLQDNFSKDIAKELGIPSEIMVVMPPFSDINIRHDIPREINVKSVGIPEKIEITGLVIPNEISLIGEIPKSIYLDVKDLPPIIKLDASDIPAIIKLESIVPIPTVISFDASGLPSSIKVEGIPETIELRGSLPSVIDLRVPENLEVPLVYKGGPIPVQFDMKNLTGEGDDTPCFAIIPCKK